MDKKTAEQEALRKTKDAQAAAGKSSGMSGRDLVSCIAAPVEQYTDVTFLSSNTTQNGSRTKKMETKTNGT
jgi:hypothetical protein